MKNLKIIGIVFLILSITSCSDDDSINNSPQTQQEIENLVQSNNFIITNFIDSGNDETGHFNCYSFTFNTNGTLMASNGINNYSGNWSITNSNSSNDSSSDLDFNISFALTNEFEDLNDDWDIVSYNSNSIVLIDVSGGNGGTDNLTFQIGNPAINCTSQIQNTVSTNVQDGTWKITSFIDSGIDETNNFTGYNFSFNSSGNVNATNGTNSYDGIWSVTDSNSSNDNLGDLDFNINFNLTNDFQDLNDDWDFVSQTSTKIELKDISGGNGDIDYLTFEKN